ncbi:MAG: formylglycine-generating enzyme family protein [Flavobacteriales bacterium]|nr:formylglycine-generating enzyme family protein [Flavobacteriales bacterium]
MKHVLTLLLVSVLCRESSAQVDTFALAEGISLEMVLVEGGPFLMGDYQGDKDNRPAHLVILDNFHIGRFEVTQGQWMGVMGYNPSQMACGRCPVNNMSWDQIQDFLAKLCERTGRRFRLPTEAEWEYAAQGGKHTGHFKFSGSDNVADVAWIKFNGGDQQHEVGKLKPNELGLYDMNGNAWELCEDWYDPKFYANSPRKNPVNTKPAKYRVSRGGSWMSPEEYCFRWARNNDHPHHRRGNGGFRVVMEP